MDLQKAKEMLKKAEYDATTAITEDQKKEANIKLAKVIDIVKSEDAATKSTNAEVEQVTKEKL